MIIKCLKITTCLKVISFFFFLVQPRLSDFQGVTKRWPLPLHVQTQIPAAAETCCLSVCVTGLKTHSLVHIKTQHLRQLPDGVFRFCKAARVAVSKTSQIPSLVLAEHSK